MDPVSAIFASYLELVSQKTTERMSDVLGLEVQTVSVTHQNIRVPYAYQMWKVQHKSICRGYKYHIANVLRVH